MPKDIQADIKIQVVDGKPVELPNGDFVANAHMSREGMDLHLTSPDGHTITVEGYFAQGTAPDLFTADGARLSPNLVNSFLPPEHTGQYASSGQIANDASPAGRIAEVSGEANIIRADGTHVVATVNTPIFQGDVIETSKTGAVNVQFADNTSFAISESARMSVDKFMYDSEHHSGSSFFSMLQGVFVYTSGLIGKADPGSVNIETPVGSIGIRGTVVAGQISPAGHESKITILDGAITFTNGSGTHEMHDSYNTVSLNSYQNHPTDMGHMDSNTFQQAFHSVSVVAGETFSHFSGGTGSNSNGNAQQNGENNSNAPAANESGEHGGDRAAPKGANEGGQGSAPPQGGEHGPAPDGMAPVPGAMPPGGMPPGGMPPAMNGEHGAMNGMPPGGTMPNAPMTGAPMMNGMPAGMIGGMPGDIGGMAGYGSMGGMPGGMMGGMTGFGAMGGTMMAGIPGSMAAGMGYGGMMPGMGGMGGMPGTGFDGTMGGMPGMGYGGMMGGMPGMGYGGMMGGMPGMPGMYGGMPAGGFYYGAPAYNTAGYYNGATYNPPPVNPPPAGSPPPPPPPFTLGFAYSGEYNDIIKFPDGPGIREFGPNGMMVGTVMPFNAAAGAITFNIAVNLANPVYHLTPTMNGHTDAITATLLSAGQQADITTIGGITAGEVFSLYNGTTTANITITAGESIQNLINDINSYGAFHAQMIQNRLEIATTSNVALTVANVTGTPATDLLSAANVTTLPPSHDYSLSNINPVSAFSVDGVGHIFVNDSLALSSYVNPNGFNLTITATDSLGHNTTITQHLDIRDYSLGTNPEVSNSSNLYGTSGADYLVGLGGAAMTIAGGGGADVILGSNGNNSINIQDAGYEFVDGGAGYDVLSLGVSGSTQFFVDFTNVSTGWVNNVEEIDLGTSNASGNGNHIRLDLEAVFDMTDASHTLNITASGSGGSQIDIVTSGGSAFALTSGTLSSSASNMTYTGTYNGAAITLVITGGMTTAADAGHMQVSQV